MKDISEILEGLKVLFDSGKVFCFIGPALIVDPTSRRPMDRWSLSNRLWTMFSGTNDARGFRQWEEVGRRVRKGAKAIYILAPSLRTITRDSEERPGEKEKTTICTGFLAVPVFRKEDTEGEPLPQHRPEQAPPLAGVAASWGLPVYYEASADGAEQYYGYYRYSGEKNITLLTHDTYTWLHELCHAAHDRLAPLATVAHVDRELVAEFGAAALARALGFSDETAEASALAYCRTYAKSTGDPARALVRVLDDVQKVCELILSTARATASEAA